jgi:hypothetical protein
LWQASASVVTFELPAFAQVIEPSFYHLVLSVIPLMVGQVVGYIFPHFIHLLARPAALDGMSDTDLKCINFLSAGR